MPDSSPARLPCDTDLDDLVAQVIEGRADQRTRHQQTCPHCQRRLDQLTTAWRHIDHLHRVRIHAPAGFVHRVMTRVRRDPRNGVVLHHSGPGSTTVATTVLELLATLAAHRIDDVITVHDVHVTPAPEVVILDITIAWDRPIIDLADRVRADVFDTTRATAGVTLAGVDVRVVAIQQPAKLGSG